MTGAGVSGVAVRTRSRRPGEPLPPRTRAALVVALMVVAPLSATIAWHDHQRQHLTDPSAPLGYLVLDHQTSDPGRPVTYDPCIVLHVVVNHREAPPQADRMVADAVRSVAAATHLPIVLDSGDVPRRLDLSLADRDLKPFEHRRDVLVGWATPEEVPELAGPVEGSAVSSIEHGHGDDEDDYLLDGQVALDAGVFAELAGEQSGFEQSRAIVMHELGHVVGLGHVHDSDELMFPTTSERLDWGAGDLRGLAAMGGGRCRRAGSREEPWDPGPGT